MTTNTKKEQKQLDNYILLQQLKQRLEDSWSGFTQVIEEAEEFLEDIKEAEEKEIIDYAETEDLNFLISVILSAVTEEEVSKHIPEEGQKLLRKKLVSLMDKKLGL